MSFQYNFMTFGVKPNRILVYHLRRPISSGFAGMVLSKLFPIKVALVVKNELVESGIPGRLSATPGGTMICVEMTADIFYGIKRNRKIARVTLLHELGHFFHDHHKNGQLDTEEYLQMRCDAAKAGNVLPMELEADRFAAEYLGTEYTCEGLRELIEYTRKLAVNGIITDKEETELSITELEQRIEMLKK